MTTPATDTELLSRYHRLGFVDARREHQYVVPVPAAHDALVAWLGPVDGHAFVRADTVDADRLRLLDDELRQDVPGTDGWQWSAEDFREETFNPAFDPELYLVAVDTASDAYAGLVRVWNRPRRPRLGMIGVVRSRRREGLARALLARVFAVLHQRGVAEIKTEADVTNVASTSLLESLGAQRVGVSVELVRPAGPLPAAT